MPYLNDNNESISENDVLFLKNLGFATENIPQDEELWTSYFVEMPNHPHIDNLSIAVNARPGKITAYSLEGDVFLEKDFSQATLLRMLAYFGYPGSTSHNS